LPVPFAPELERLYLPDAAKVADAVRATVGKKTAAAS
jgi:hypothetical protein